MAIYLRDQHIENVSIDAEALTQISDVFMERFNQVLLILPEGSPQAPAAFITYVIRFDNKGYRVFSLVDLMQYFNLANEVERVIFTVESRESMSSNRNVGAYLELCLNAKEPTRCVLAASSDHKDWTEASFAAVHAVLAKCKTKNGIARNPWTSLLIQILGVILCFIVSLWLASEVASNVNVENSFIISFLFILLVFSNIWGYLNQIILSQITKLFPNIEFIRPAKARLHWLLQVFVGSAAITVVVYVLGKASSFFTKVLASFLDIGA